MAYGSRFMKGIFKILSILLVLSAMFSCSSPDFSLQGRWIVERVNFDFDERRNTPEMISQFGSEESKDELIFKNDSVVYISMLDYNGDYQYMMNENSEIFLKDKADVNRLGFLKDNKIYSEHNTAIGKMRITFIKED